MKEVREVRAEERERPCRSSVGGRSEGRKEGAASMLTHNKVLPKEKERRWAERATTWLEILHAGQARSLFRFFAASPFLPLSFHHHTTSLRSRNTSVAVTGAPFRSHTGTRKRAVLQWAPPPLSRLLNHPQLLASLSWRRRTQEAQRETFLLPALPASHRSVSWRASLPSSCFSSFLPLRPSPLGRAAGSPALGRP